MASRPSECAVVAGSGAASDYARRLLGDLGLAVTSAPGPRDPHPALAWAASGAMAITGWPHALPRVPSGALASCAAGAGRALAAIGARAPEDPAALLAERAALFGLARRGRIAPGGACRLLRARDGWAALTLARDDDRRALPAWLEAGGSGVSDWDGVERELARRPLAWLAERARWLGIAFAPAAPAPASAALWFTASECGPRGDPPRRAPRARDRALLAALFASADVVIESARPRALAQLGIDAEAFVAARAGRVWISITGYGRADAAPGRVAFGDDAAVAAGAARAVADADGPLFCADAIADPLTGLHAAVAAWACWRAGGGVLLDLSLCGVTAHALAFASTGAFEVSGSAGAARVRAACGEARVAAPRARRACARARSAGADTEALRQELAC